MFIDYTKFTFNIRGDFALLSKVRCLRQHGKSYVNTFHARHYIKEIIKQRKPGISHAHVHSVEF